MVIFSRVFSEFNHKPLILERSLLRAQISVSFGNRVIAIKILK